MLVLHMRSHRGEEERFATFDEQLRQIESSSKKIRSLTAQFVQARHTPLLKKPMVSHGHVELVNEYLRWETKAPHPSTMLVGAACVKLYYPEDSLLEIYPVGGRRAGVAGVPLPQFSEISDQFNILQVPVAELNTEADPNKFLGVHLIPRTAEIRRQIGEMQILIDIRQSVATKIIMIGADAERTEIVFTKIRLNEIDESKELEIDLPEKVSVIWPVGPVECDDGVAASEQ